MTGLREVWAVFAVRLLLGAARTFPMPSSQTITPNLVPAVVFGVLLRLPLRVCGSGFSQSWRNRIVFREACTAVDFEFPQLRILGETAETTDRNMDESWDSIEKS